MRLPSFIASLAIAIGLLALAPLASLHAQEVSLLSSAEALADSWDRLAHRNRLPQIHQTNQFELAGVSIAKTAISKDATTLLVLDTEGALLFYDLKTGKQTFRTVPEQASSEAVINIAYNGKVAMVGLPTGLIQVYFHGREKPAYQYDAFKTPIEMLSFSADQIRVIAVDQFGKSFEVNSKGVSKGFHPGPSEDKRITSWVAAGAARESSWKVMVTLGGKVTDVYHDGKERTENNLELEPPAFIDSSGERFVVGGDKQLATCMMYVEGGTKFNQMKLYTPLYDGGFLTGHPWIWTLSDTYLELRNQETLRIEKRIDLPAGLPPEHTQVFPDNDRLVTVTPEGQVTVWDAYLDAGTSLQDLLKVTSQEFAAGRFDAFEELARRWNDRTENFEDNEHETPYTYLMRIVQRNAVRDQGPDAGPYQNLHDWVEKNPDNCKFMRIALFRLYLADGYQARGDGFANTVTEEGWQAFYDNMERSWDVLEPLFDEEEVPAEGYTSAIIAGKNLQWDREIVNQYLRQAFEKYPTYHRTFTEEAIARLPRWGGKPGETEYLARFTADKLGGEEGDILYAQISQHVARFVGWDNIDTETSFSRERILQGMLAMLKTTENQKTIYQVLRLGIRWDNEDVGMAAALRLIELTPTSRNMTDEVKQKATQDLYDRMVEKQKQKDKEKEKQ